MVSYRLSVAQPWIHEPNDYRSRSRVFGNPPPKVLVMVHSHKVGCMNGFDRSSPLRMRQKKNAVAGGVSLCGGQVWVKMEDAEVGLMSAVEVGYYRHPA